MLVGYEYWFNSLEKTSVEIAHTESFMFEQNIPTNSLLVGLHQFNIRFVDSEGVWSSIVSRYFYKLPVVASAESSTISEFQYWIDNDFEHAISIAYNQEVVQIDELLSMSDLKNGLHQFNVRFKDSKGVWSSIKTTHFYKLPVVASAESSTISEFQYWIDNDFEHATSV
ncbi:MAG: hypothetical protein M0R02_10450, partial [Bacteroidales bacterium]|nr:hypothetical protein [Bacteroidales bacterium]